MALSIVVVSAGVEEWDLFTVPALNSLRVDTRKHQIITVDNGGPGRGTVNIPNMVPYAQAANAGAREAIYERLVILNNDITAADQWLNTVVESSTPYGGPVILTKENIAYVEGWCIIIDTELWHLLNGFDEAYRNSWEDVDLAWRLSRLQIHPYKIPVRMNHIWGATRARYPGSNRWDGQNRQRLIARIRERKYEWQRKKK